MCRDAGLAPTFVTVAEPRIEHVLLSVAAGAGPALVPDSVVERCTIPGAAVRGARRAPAFQTAVLTHRDTKDIATVSLLRALARAAGSGAADKAPAVEVAA